MIAPVDVLVIVLVLAVAIGCINYRWIRLPPSIAMLLGSLAVSPLIVASDRVFHLHAMSWFRGTLDATHFPRVFLNAVLALLLFAELNRRRSMILVLATASVVISTVIFCFGIWGVFAALGLAVPRAWCFVLGAILAPTDAVVVENLLRRLSLPPGLSAAIVGETCSTMAPASCSFCWRSASPKAKRWFSATARCCLRSCARSSAARRSGWWRGGRPGA